MYYRIIICDWFSWGWSNFFFLKKKLRIADSKKLKTANSQYFFAKISEIGAWISRINWCEGYWCGLIYMAVRLSNVRSKTCKKKAFFVFFAFFRPYDRQPDSYIGYKLGTSIPLASIHPTDPRTNSWKFLDKILNIGWDQLLLLSTKSWLLVESSNNWYYSDD